MKDQKSLHTPWEQLAIANDFNGIPPNRPRIAAGTPRREPTLTEKFNAATKKPHLHAVLRQPTSKLQIEALQKKLSQPRLTFNRSPLGTVTNVRNPHADRVLMETITALTAQLAARKGLKERFALAANKGELKKQFNQSSQGKGM
ncbi:MAG: hypothetical protein GXP26_13235 [Planctomycetes bacterium]|nr:hypothetical protein [Planctomycetota bacterium]